MSDQSRTNYDSEFCGNLPIHLINVIQPYAVLIVFDSTNRIIQVSENVQSLFEKAPPAMIGADVFQLIPGLKALGGHDKIPETCDIGEANYAVILHHKADYSILEINLHSASIAKSSSFLDVYQELRTAIQAIESAPGLHEAVVIAAQELKSASGFDKVMIYRFDRDWNGHVLAEASEPDMESYLGFTFPASDIPRQARELYLKNAYRLIPDANYQPVKLYPVINPASGTFIDMSDCNLRGVSSVHLEYLRNMNVSASMSTRILKDGQLWGLIACHNKTPIDVDYKMCAVFELLSGIISGRTTALDNAERHHAESAISEVYTRLIRDTYRTSDISESLLGENNSVLNLFDASGAVLLHRGVITSGGIVPDRHEIEDLLLWLHTRNGASIYTTDNLSRVFDYAAEYTDRASGLMSIPIDSDKDEYLLLFRPEVIRVINWGGDPATRINFEKDMKTYHPRHSFKLWQEKVSGVSQPWTTEQLEVAENLKTFVQEFLRINHTADN